jgi:hypothetical protein
VVFDNEHRNTSSPGMNPFYDRTNSGGVQANEEDFDELFTRDQPTVTRQNQATTKAATPDEVMRGENLLETPNIDMIMENKDATRALLQQFFK